ncbi:MAG: substrate-binding domain-containing protein [Clostridia bacterium]|nr:substrate-binding domain-containing protein [Clostridia bacterium]
MKKGLMILVTIIIICAIILGCVFWYKSATMNNAYYEHSNNETSNVENSGNVESNSIEESTDTPLFTKDNYPRVDASLAIHPLVDSIAANFLGVQEDELDYEYTKTRTSDVYKNLVDGKVDVIFVAEPSEADYEYAKSKGVELEVTPVTSSAFVFIVNVNNKVDTLTLDEIVKIYKGEITNWKEVGGDDEEIIPYQRPNGSGSQTAMISLVMKDASFMTAPKMQIQGEMGGLIDAIAEYDNSKAAIGYSYFYYVNTMYKRDTIKMIGVNGVKPTLETIKDGTYPIYTNGYIVTLKGISEDSNTKKWISNVLSSRGSKIIEDAGYVPIH